LLPDGAGGERRQGRGLAGLAGGLAGSARRLAGAPARMLGRRASYLLILPAAAIYVGLFVSAALWFFVISFWRVKNFRPAPDFTLQNYAKTFTTHLGSVETTLLIAFAIAVSATLLGFYYAWLIRFRAGSWGPALLFIALVTLFGGYLMKIYAWKTMLGGDGA